MKNYWSVLEQEVVLFYVLIKAGKETGMGLNITKRWIGEQLHNMGSRNLTDSLKRQEAGLCENGYEISGSEKCTKFRD